MDQLCGWGCGQLAVLPRTKYSKGQRCTERVYDCPAYKKNHKNNLNPWNKGKKMKNIINSSGYIIVG